MLGQLKKHLSCGLLKWPQYLNSFVSVRHPVLMKWLINCYPPYLGAQVRVQHLDIDRGKIVVVMPLTFFNKNIVGTQFGGSLYSMTDPFFMLLLMEKLGKNYVVWDKAASIDFVKAGTGKVSTSIALPAGEIDAIQALAQDGRPVFRQYELQICDQQGVVAVVKKTLYIRLRAFSKSKDRYRRF